MEGLQPVGPHDPARLGTESGFFENSSLNQSNAKTMIKGTPMNSGNVENFQLSRELLIG